MLRTKKNKSLLLTLYDREINNVCAPYFLSISVISQILRSDAPLFKNYWQKSSKRPITYDCGYLYFNDYTSCFTLYGKNCKPSSLFKLQKSKAQKKVSDVISYSIPVYKTLDNFCECYFQTCVCLSQYLLSISEDNWLCQHSMSSGKLIREFYVNRIGHKFSFKYCDWDVYSDRFVLTSTLNPDVSREETSKKSNVVVNLAIFTASPFDFSALLEIKRSIFGDNCTAANISDQHLILGMGYTQVNIYSFIDFINQGDLTPYKIGENYGDNGKIGSYPTGLPLNFTYSSAPPLLFNVQCFGQIIRFGGYPYHYITAAAKNSHLFTVTNIETNIPAIDGSLQSNSFNDDVDALLFHPDHSNRLIFKDASAVHCFKLLNVNGMTKLCKSFSMGFSETNTRRNDISSFGRRIKSRPINNYGFECTIFCTDYASDLDLFAIMGVSSGDSDSVGFVKLYDSLTGEEVRTLKLKQKVSDYNFYQLYIDMGSIILIERRDGLIFTVHVYNM